MSLIPDRRFHRLFDRWSAFHSILLGLAWATLLAIFANSAEPMLTSAYAHLLAVAATVIIGVAGEQTARLALMRATRPVATVGGIFLIELLALYYFMGEILFVGAVG